MKEKKITKRVLSLVLAACMVLGYALPANAVSTGEVKFTKVDNSAVEDPLDGRVPVEEEEETPVYKDTDVVRVSIVLKDKSTVEAGFSTQGIAANTAAMKYRDKLEAAQTAVEDRITAKLGEKLDVVWNLTLTANIISANVAYGQIEAIGKVPGVKEVFVETRYEPDVAQKGEADPNMSTSGKQIGSAFAWNAGFTGAGSRIAVIDTGTDSDHQSFSAEAFEYSLSVLAEKAGKPVEEYVAGLDLLDAEEIAAVAGELNVEIDPQEAYFNSKLPFIYNYVDGDYDITHDNDGQGEHGSHVAGIAAANAYIPTGGGFEPALSSVYMQGVAPDAQIITMKVFGKTGGAYDSDYMAAIEDAIVLGCDAVNLSLGSGNPGRSRELNYKYQEILDGLVDSDTVVTISAGNSGSWVESANNAGYLYYTDVSMQTNGSPGAYTNSLSVASVDNDGTTGYYIAVGDTKIFYTETTYSNKSLTSIAGEREFVFIDGFGTAEDWAAVGNALKGKIAICSRGSISFYEKGDYAVEAGAIATIIYNNEAGMINMDLSSYGYTQPVVSITQADGAAIKAAAVPVTDENGNVLYYTGTMQISDKLFSGQYNSEYYTMSSFSSWGVPGSLELKPEITAPGGSIYSVNGQPAGGTAYEVMSGTSMAAPQVAGMAAIVAQYIRETGLDEKTDLTVRVLSQSLLMSTAVPVIDGNSGTYYPVIQQGAGLANVGDAISAVSYILMGSDATDSWQDGKVKVELGDDPGKAGAYTFSFSVNNLTDLDKAYTLSADFFTQDTFEYYANGNMSEEELAWYMDTWCAALEAATTFTVNGKTLEAGGDLTGMDFNGDGKVNELDGQALLDYATGARTVLTNEAKADLDGDGDIDSYDAYLFFTRIENALVVPANGSVEVTVTVTLSEAQKAELDENYPNGAYIEGFVFAKGVSSEEGVKGTVHSIPVLGFYGNWTDPSMFEIGSYQEYATGEEIRLPYLGDPDVNTFLVTYADEPKSQYCLGGNPMVPDTVYMPERDAINSGNAITGLRFAAIRNVAASRFTAVNTTTGESLAEAYPGGVDGAYYHVTGGAWVNTGYTINTKFSIGEAADGDVITAGLTLAPEYYMDAQGNVDWDALGAGATFATQVVVDNTEPELFDVSVDLETNTLTVTASDNQYVSAVALYNKAGTKVYTYTGAKQDIEKGEVAEYSMSLNGVNGKRFLVQVFDYAMNAATYLIEMQIGEEVPLPEMIVFDLSFNYWTTFTKDTVYEYPAGMPVYENSDLTFYAATIVDHMVLASTNTGDLYVMPEDDLTDLTYISNVGTVLTDMAYNKADGNVYAVDESGNLVRIDKLTGELTTVGSIGVSTNTLACDENGTFYCNEYGTGNVCSFTLNTIYNPTILVDDIIIDSSFIQTMEINPNTGMLCWNSYYKFLGVFGFSYYYEIDPATGEWTEYEDLWDEFSCLIIPEKTGSVGSWTEPTEEVSGVKLSDSSLTLLKGGTRTLSATVQPWTAADRTVTWTSADETIATVNEKGDVTGVGVGTTTVTATSNLDPSISATCTVTVETLDVTIKGMLQDAEGKSEFFNWNMETDDTWTAGAEVDTSVISATYSAKEKAYYVMDATESTWAMHKVGEDGVSIQTAANPSGVPLWDMEYSEYFTEVNGEEMVNSIYYYYLLTPKDPMNLDTKAFNLSSNAEYLTAITSLGYEEYWSQNEQTMLDTEHLVLLDNLGNLLHLWIFNNAEGMSAYFSSYPSDLPCAFEGYNSMTYMYTSMVVGEDGALYLSTFNGETNELYRLTFDEASASYKSDLIGDFGQDVWPAIITEVTSNDAAEANALVTPKDAEKITAEVVTAGELAAVKAPEARTAAKTFALTDETRLQKASETAKEEAPEASELKLFAPGTVVAPLSSATVDEDENILTVQVTAKDAAGADVASTNGVATVTYDTAALTLKGVAVNGDYTSKVEAEGTVTFGYVKLDSFAAGETVATLTFEIKDAENSAVTVSFEDVNNDNPGSSEKVEEACKHTETEVKDAREADCENKGYTGDTYCLDCGELVAKGEEIPATGHSYKDVVTAPTTESEGYTTHTCENCGHSYKDTFTDKLPVEDPGNADTGDTFMAGLWITVMVVCAAGMAVLVFSRKKLFND